MERMSEREEKEGTKGRTHKKRERIGKLCSNEIIKNATHAMKYNRHTHTIFYTNTCVFTYNLLHVDCNAPN